MLQKKFPPQINHTTSGDQDKLHHDTEWVCRGGGGGGGGMYPLVPMPMLDLRSASFDSQSNEVALPVNGNLSMLGNSMKLGKLVGPIFS